MTVRVGINGFGRIGRNYYRANAQQTTDDGLGKFVSRWFHGEQIEIVSVNDLGSVDTMAHLLKYDSVHGTLDSDVEVTDNGISVDGIEMGVTAIRDPKDLPWGDLDVDVVIEATGIFNSRDAAAAHLEAGAPVVIVSAPCSGADATFVMGVNEDDFDFSTQKVVSNASCTTNCFVPMVKVLDDAFGLEKGLMTTVHGYTGDQALVDGPHSDLRRARAAAINIIPTSTGAARATGLVLPEMQGKLDGIALRVPVPDGSLTDFVGTLKSDVTPEQVNEAYAAAASDGPLKDVLEYSEQPLVSTDIVGTPASCTIDSGLTMAVGNLVKVCGWYDNEWGYSNRLVDLTRVVGAAVKAQ
jgi:glyceraldehyde 3-phosphate dehydrogenase